MKRSVKLANDGEFEYVDKLTDDDAPVTEKYKANFNPLEAMSEVFY